MEELRHKSFEDLHTLWWKCCKERNVLATQAHERKRVGNLGGEIEAEDRDLAVRKPHLSILGSNCNADAPSRSDEHNGGSSML